MVVSPGPGSPPPGPHSLPGDPQTNRPIARRAFAILAAALLTLLALLPRAAGLSDFYTTDEAYFWQGRVARFSAALQMGDWAATNQTGHPGVTTMWLGALGRLLALQAGLPEPGPGAGAGFLALMRLPLAVANALAVGLGYLLLRRLIRPASALLAGILWATSPFLIAHSRLLHLDALLTSLLSLALLALLAATAGPRLRPALFVASAICAGLALLTKAPALIMPPLAGLILLGHALAQAAGEPHAAPPPLWTRRAAPLLAALRAYALWLGIAALTFTLLWPAMWVDAPGALGALFGEVSENGAQPHNAGNFFMGAPVADPGWTFYLTVLRWRGEPPLTLGLAALAAGGLRLLLRPRRPPGDRRRPAPPLLHPAERRTTLILIGFSLLFTLAVSLLAKKFDRYLLPIWPALAALAAVGLIRLADWWRASDALGPTLARQLAGGLALAGLTLALARPLVAYPPYFLAYYSPFVGGGATAQQALLVGWGEGMEQVGAWLSARPDLRRGPVLSWLPATLAPFLPADVAVYDLDVEALARDGSYAVVYTSVAERDQRSVAEAYALQTPPLLTLRIHGVTYATVHQLPRPFAQTVGAVFEEVHLRGVSYRLSGSTLTITPSWDIQGDRAEPVWCFIHILDAQGRRVAQVDAPIDDGLFGSWQTGQQFGSPLPISLPADLPAGRYQAVLGLYTPASGARLSLLIGAALPESLSGPGAVGLFSFTLPADEISPLPE